MRKSTLALAVSALLVALLAGYLAKRWSGAGAEAPAPARTVEVVVLERDVAAGAPLGPTDLRYDSWPEGTVPAGIVHRRPGGEDVKATAVGKAARRSLTAGEPLAENATAGRDASGTMAGIIGKGMRAASLSVTGAGGVSGFVSPGDFVDVVLGSDIRHADGDPQNAGEGVLARYAAETVLRGVKVVAIDQTISKNKDGSPIQGKTATLEVTPRQAEILVAAQMLGNLSLVLRAAGEPEGKDAEAEGKEGGFTPDIGISRALAAFSAAKEGAAKAAAASPQQQAPQPAPAALPPLAPSAPPAAAESSNPAAEPSVAAEARPKPAAIRLALVQGGGGRLEARFVLPDGHSIWARRGDLLPDRSKVVSLTADAAVLEKDGESRTVRINGVE